MTHDRTSTASQQVLCSSCTLRGSHAKNCAIDLSSSSPLMSTICHLCDQPFGSDLYPFRRRYCARSSRRIFRIEGEMRQQTTVRSRQINAAKCTLIVIVIEPCRRHWCCTDKNKQAPDTRHKPSVSTTQHSTSAQPGRRRRCHFKPLQAYTESVWF